MFSSLPDTVFPFMQGDWSRIEPYYHDLARRDLRAADVTAWLADWSRLSELVAETQSRLAVGTTVNTADREANERYRRFLDQISPRAQAAEQILKTKLLASGLEPPEFGVPLRNMRAEADLFREENLPLLTEEEKLGTEYDRVSGAQTVEWEGRPVTLRQLSKVYHDPDRALRERAWRLEAQRRLADREALGALWTKCMSVRGRIAAGAGLPDYRQYRWRQLLRFDYTPEDAHRFHRAVEEVVVPAMMRRGEKRRRRLGLARLRPWDMEVDPLSRPPLKPFEKVPELVERVGGIFQRLDPALGEYFDIMRRENLLDLDNREHKAPGGYMDTFAAAKRPFIFMNAVGLQADVQTLLHESGHAFHFFEMAHLPYHPQRNVPLEACEVASMAMELVAAPYLSVDRGGFYSVEDAARARAEHLERVLFLWAFVALADAFQHWVYTHHQEAADPANCGVKFQQLAGRFTPASDWSGLEDVLRTRWQRVRHFFCLPFYYLEYGLAELGAVQVWANARRDPAGALARYRQALSLGGTVALPGLFAAAGATFAFDARTLGDAVRLIEETLEELDPA